MVKLDLIHSANSVLVSSHPLVAVFVGGTSGIGAHSIKYLAHTNGKDGKDLRAYIIGRNVKAAEEIISECQALCPKGKFIFLRTSNLALMKDVDIACKELMEIEKREASSSGGIPRIDILVMTQANFKPWDSRNETTEGLDTFMSLLYYSRMRFTMQLLPLLLSSTLPARVISVFGPGRDANFTPSDLSLRKPQNYGFGNSGSHASYLITFFMEYLAAKHPRKLSLIHYFPGLVLGEVFQDPEFPFWFRAIFKYGAPIIKLAPMALDGAESGARVLFNASERFPPKGVAVRSDSAIGVAGSSDGIAGGGAYRVNYNNEQVPTGKQYKSMREDGWGEKCIQHTFKAWNEIEAGRVFKD